MTCWATSTSPVQAGHDETINYCSNYEESTMTNLRDRPNTALLVVDVQNGVFFVRR